MSGVKQCNTPRGMSVLNMSLMLMTLSNEFLRHTVESHKQDPMQPLALLRITLMLADFKIPII